MFFLMKKLRCNSNIWKSSFNGQINCFFQYHVPSLGKYYEINAFSPRKKQFIAFFTDITDRKKAEEALQKSENLMNKSQKIAHLGSWRTDLVK